MTAKNIKDRIKEYFFLNPTNKLRVRQIEREIKIPLPSVIRYTKELEKEGILKKEETSGAVFFSSDRSSQSFLLEKKFFNTRLIFESGLIDFIIKEYSNPVIIVFGSYSKGEDIENSDVDLYIQSLSKKEINLEKFEKQLKRKIQIFIYPSINKVKNPHLSNNIINGIILNNFLEVFK
ncbi:MAG: nucleotidyltransferase domain-containing protein [Nanoarchaeota archaeon]